MTTSRYTELLPVVFASSDDLVPYRQSIESDGWTLNYAAPSQYVQPGVPVSLSLVNMRENDDRQEARRAANDDRLPPLEALVLLLELLNNLEGRGNTQARMARAQATRDPRTFMRQGLGKLAGVSRRDFDLIDPNFRLRYSLYGTSVLPERTRWLQTRPNRTGLKLASSQRVAPTAVRTPLQMTAQLPAPTLGSGNVAAFQSRGRKKRWDLDPTPFPQAI